MRPCKDRQDDAAPLRLRDANVYARGNARYVHDMGSPLHN
jgi:hypothetical protein